MRIMLPAGSRKAQSRTAYGFSVGSWTTSTSPTCSRSRVPSGENLDVQRLRVRPVHPVANAAQQRDGT
jgi:hypothetical protein